MSTLSGLRKVTSSAGRKTVMRESPTIVPEVTADLSRYYGQTRGKRYIYPYRVGVPVRVGIWIPSPSYNVCDVQMGVPYLNGLKGLKGIGTPV